MNPRPKIIIIVGPTASGKTALAVSLAKKLSGEVISADSRQVYRHLDIGTAKITKAEMEGIPHHLIDICEPDETYTPAQWVHDAQQVIADIGSRARVPIIAGGTMQYVDALLGIQSIPRVPPNPKLRERLEKLDTCTLSAMLAHKDPERAHAIDRHNPRRLVRALEIVEALGSVPKPVRTESPYDALIIGLRMETEVLKDKIFTRLEKRINEGLIEETREVLTGGVTKTRLREIGLEYRVALAHIEGTITEPEMRQKLKEKVWQYAKRQLTWLKKMENVEWFLPSEQEKILARCVEFLRS